MNCKLCGKSTQKIVYKGKIRDGKIGNYTKSEISMYECEYCGAIFHETFEDLETLYETEEYRNKMGEVAEKSQFDSIHDVENFEKFRYTGMDIFRGKTVADIGCGGGSFLDCIGGVASEVVAIEPTEAYHSSLKNRGYRAYSYASEALECYARKVDTVVSFDVIEHVENPMEFIKDIKSLLKEGGVGVIGTPTDAPVMRSLLGDVYSSFLFSTQHPWVLGEKSFSYIAKMLDIQSYECLYFQRYGLNNLFNWLKTGQPRGKEEFEFVTSAMDKVWVTELEKMRVSDYIVFKFAK